jgi:hypothetical protein
MIQKVSSSAVQLKSTPFLMCTVSSNQHHRPALFKHQTAQLTHRFAFYPSIAQNLLLQHVVCCLCNGNIMYAISQVPFYVSLPNQMLHFTHYFFFRNQILVPLHCLPCMKPSTMLSWTAASDQYMCSLQ